ncbi:IclR family transcriptional regulator C-terminal domain-containing protein [Thalassospiraceae bacterium LMO-JJ14]|nr:IclR family transcriptional regulator C-terminal domain-containing protein [Thalassospiraceae bacterium LMO-JJ14]
MATARAARRGAGAKKATAASTGQVQSLTRALGLMNAISESDDGATLTELSQQVGLAASTAHRLLSTLELQRYVRFDQEQSRWFIGVQAFAIGHAFVRTRNLVQFARPVMRQLMEESGETVNLAVEDGGEVIFLCQIECRQVMRALVPEGARAAMHCSGVGKALLAYMSDPRLTKILEKRGLHALTAKTIIKPKTLREELKIIRENGYAVDDEEHAVGLRCVAAPIFDEHDTAVAAISVSGPAARVVTDRIPVLGELVRRAASAISHELGCGVRV